MEQHGKNYILLNNQKQLRGKRASAIFFDNFRELNEDEIYETIYHVEFIIKDDKK